MHDHTFGELVFGPHDISRAAFNWQGSFLKKARSVVGLERHIPQPG
jgi:hypothetical protein